MPDLYQKSRRQRRIALKTQERMTNWDDRNEDTAIIRLTVSTTEHDNSVINESYSR